MRILSFLSSLFITIGVQAQSLETIIQKGHELAVTSIAVSPDSNYVATGSKDKSIKLWELKTGREVRSLLGHEMTVNSIRFSPDGKQLISGSNDKTIRIWDLTTGKSLQTISTTDYIIAVAVDPLKRFFVAGGYNDSGYPDSAMVYDLKSYKLIRKLPIDARNTLGIMFSPDGKLLAFGEDNRVASVFSTDTWQRIHQFTFTDGWCGGCYSLVQFSPEGRFMYMASHNGPVKKYAVASKELIKVYEESTDDLTGLAVSADGKYLARATELEVSVWDEASGKLISKLVAEEKGEFNEVTFTLDSKQLLVTSNNTTVISWDYAHDKKEVKFAGFLNKRDQGGLNYDPNFYWQSAIARFVRFKNSLLITQDGKSLIKGKFGTKVKRWDIASGKTMMEYVGHTKAVLCYALSKDGKRLLTGGGDGKIMLWNVETGDSIQSITSYQEPIFDIQFNSDETQVISSSWDGTMRLHDLKTGQRELYIEFEKGSAYAISYHPNDLYVFTARLDNTLQLWEKDTKQVVRNFIGHTDVISSIRLSKDQKTLLSAGWDRSIRLWDVGTGLMIKKLHGVSGAVHTAVFSADEKFVFAAGADRIIRVWDVATGKIVRTFDGHLAEVTSLLFSSDNKMLVSHSVDGVTKFWDLSTGKEFFEHIHLGENDWMVKNPDGYFNGTDQARQYIHFVSGMKTYSVDQFFHEFYRPDLLPKIFQNRGGNSNESKGIQGRLNSSPPPTVKIAVVQTAVEGKAEVYVRLIDNGAGVENLRIQHNGKSIPVNRDVLKYPSGKGQIVTYKEVVDLVGGTNTFSAIARNRDNIESDPQTVEVFSDHASQSSTCHILAIGINQYKNSKLNLNYAKPDAESFSEIMEGKNMKLFKDIKLHTLYDGEATRQKILQKLDELQHEIHPEDVFIFYYAGHGSMVDDKFYFIPTESLRLYDAGSLQKEAIEASVLQDRLRHIRALKQLIIMDACQSGGSVELLATRGASEEKAIAQLSRSAGIHVMASAGSEQFATEFTELGHGLFTYVLIKALRGAADGAPKDGKVTIYELKSYIDDQVPEMTRQLKGKPQYPYTFSRGQDFPIVIGE